MRPVGKGSEVAIKVDLNISEYILLLSVLEGHIELCTERAKGAKMCGLDSSVASKWLRWAEEAVTLYEKIENSLD